MKEIEKIIKQLLFENGICFDDEDLKYVLQMDSLTYMSLLVGMEDALNIVISDEYLVDLPKTYQGLVDMVFEIINSDK